MSLPSPAPRRVRVRLAGPVSAAALSGMGFAAAPLTPAAVPVYAGSAAVAAWSLLAGVHAFRAARRAELLAALHHGLAALIGPPARTAVRARRWRHGFVGLPARLTVHFDPQAKTHDPKWLPQLLQVCRSRTGLDYEVAHLDERRCRVVLSARAAAAAQVPVTAEAQRAERTIGELLGPTAKVRDIDLRDGQIARIEVSHENGTRLANTGYRTRVERTLSTVLPGRWRARWDLQGDTVLFEQRPSFPAVIWLDPIQIDPQTDVLGTYDSVAIEYGVDEDGRPVAWRPAIDPNLMVVGAPGTGKTSLEHCVLVQVSRFNWPVWVVDGKSIEFLGFRRDWPNVQIVATRIEEQVAVIERAWQVMEHRYDLITRGQAREEAFEPLMVFMDEFADFRANLYAWYIGVKRKGAPAEPPALEKLRSLARKGRSSRVHLLFATQRPDAKFFGDDMRDNFRARISMGRLSPQGALMMWQDPAVGTTVPRACRGRATTINDDNRPVEIQTYFIPDPRKVAAGSEAGQRLAAARPSACLHERLVILDPPVPADGADADLCYADYAGAAWGAAADHPELDPANIEQARVEDARAAASPLTVLGIGGRPAPARLGQLRQGGGGPQPEPVEPAQLDPFQGYEPAVTAAPESLQVGDLMLHPDLGEWVTVDADVEEDVTEPLNVSVFWRDDADEAGHLSLPADDLVQVRRPDIDVDGDAA
ncbi:hypothetical protein [Intrasporangium sp.]|uniref:hypothetical protein n=1 Tax=Intrasporangium sp. TaxID=1925024 RepID=UPI0032221EBF